MDRGKRLDIALKYAIEWRDQDVWEAFRGAWGNLIFFTSRAEAVWARWCTGPETTGNMERILRLTRNSRGIGVQVHRVAGGYRVYIYRCRLQWPAKFMIAPRG